MTRGARMIFARTLGELLKSATAAFAACGFLALSCAFFTRALARGEGGTTPVAALWAVSAAPFLPVLAALLTMRLVAEARESGRLELLMTAPVGEREIVLGKFMGAFAYQAGVVALYAAVPLFLLPACAPDLKGALTAFSYAPALLAMALQSALWCAAGLLASACFRKPAAAAFAALLMMLALPHLAFEAATAWMPVLRAKISSMPFEAHMVDFATGLVPLSSIVFYLSLAWFALYAAAKRVAAYRLAGASGAGKRLAAWGVAGLAFAFACMLAAVAMRLDVTVELEWGQGAEKLSERSRGILSELHGDVKATCLMARKDPAFRMVARLMRGLEAGAAQSGGGRLAVEYVDPRWDFGKAAHLARRGFEEGSIIFRRGNREVAVKAAELVAAARPGEVRTGLGGVFAGEHACASALQRLATPFGRERVLFTAGHGELSPDSYDAIGGMSDIARDLRAEGYGVGTLDLSAPEGIPEDCAAVVVAGARDPFSRAETAKLDAWMRQGGRLLALAGPGANAGAGAYLAGAGIRLMPYEAVSAGEARGGMVAARDFGDHPVTRPLKGGTAVFGRPTPIEAGETGEGAAYVELAKTDAAAWGEREPERLPRTKDEGEPAGPLALAAALERGGSLAKDVAIRPVRIVAVGDAAFVSNGALARRGNANRDLFLNAVAWLAGVDGTTATREPGNAVATGMDRDGWVRFGTLSAVAFPCCAFALWAVFFLRRRGAA